MAPEERQSKVLTAWVRATDDIALVYGDDGPAFAAVQAAAPGLASRIQDAERRAEEKSVAWVGGGPGGVQAGIDAWRDLWIEAIKLVRDGAAA
jgi:hypothetical protein